MNGTPEYEAVDLLGKLQKVIYAIRKYATSGLRAGLAGNTPAHGLSTDLEKLSFNAFLIQSCCHNFQGRECAPTLMGGFR
jgi:hypothetical protein